MSQVTVKPKELGSGAKRMNLEKHNMSRWPGTKDNIRVAGDSQIGFKVPMLDMIPNPWFKEGNGEPEQITKKAYYERRLGGSVDLGLKSKFWEDFKVSLHDGVNYFNTEDPWKELSVEVLRASNRVANSPNEVNKWPNAIYVIYDETEEVEKKAKKAEIQMEALEILKEMTPEYKRDVCRVLGKPVGNFKDGAITSVLFEFITTSPKGAERFIQVNKQPKERVKVESLIQEALVVDALRNYGGKIVRVVDNAEGDVLGMSLEKAVDFLSQKKNVMIREMIEEEIKAKKGSKVGI